MEPKSIGSLRRLTSCAGFGSVAVPYSPAHLIKVRRRPAVIGGNFAALLARLLVWDAAGAGAQTAVSSWRTSVWKLGRAAALVSKLGSSEARRLSAVTCEPRELPSVMDGRLAVGLERAMAHGITSRSARE